MSHAIQPARRCAVVAALCVLTLLGCTGRAFAAAPALDPAGVVHFAKSADSSMDQFTYGPSSAQQAWMRDHYWRMRVYTPYFDSRTSWYANGWFYKDSYAIYVGEALATQHPDWILKDSHGSKLYIQFGCGGGTCPQYAADIGNPDFRAHWIADAKATLARGYRGVFIDDVNMEMRVSNGAGNAVAPIDPRTGRPMTQAAWRRYMADFMVQIRNAMPGAEIVHNALWFDGDSDPDVARELKAADFIELERGINDSGLTGGHGQFGVETWMDFIDRRHADGDGVILDAAEPTAAGRLYGLAGYFMVSSGRDAMSNAQGGTPGDWWSGYETDLGTARGPRYQTADGVWRRDFTGGTVLLNEPGAPTRTVSLPGGLHDLDGVARTSVTLGPASGAVLVGEGAVQAPPAPAAPAKPTTTTVTAAPAKPQKPQPQTAQPRKSQPQKSQRTRARVAATAKRRHVRLSGRVHGASAGRVDLIVQRRSAHGWVRVRRVTARIARGGRFARTISARPGRYRVQARFRGDGAAKPSRSPFRRFTARP